MSVRSALPGDDSCEWILHRQHIVHLAGILNRGIDIAAALIPLLLGNQTGHRLHMEIVVVPLGAHHIHEGIHVAVIGTLCRALFPLLAPHHQQHHHRQAQPENRRG